MKKSKIFLATGALVLSIVAIVATKANKRFAPVTTALAGNYTIKAQTSAFIMNTVKNGGQLEFSLGTTTPVQDAMVTVSATRNPVFFH